MLAGDEQGAFDRAFAARLAELRKTRHLRREEVAAFLGLKPDTYGRYEAGQRGFPPHLFEKFAALTGTTIEYLVTGKGKRHRR